MSRARQVIPRRFYMITRRCTQRQFLLRPDAETNNAFAYCLAEAAKRFDIAILMTTAESNHHHTVVYDHYGRFPQFMEHFHKMLARCMNARWGRWENFWAAEEPCVTLLLDREAVIDALIYTASNPVKDQLVERATQWPGANGYVPFVERRTLRAARPKHFFRDGGVMPAEVSLELVIPETLGPAAVVIAEVRAGVEVVEARMAEQRAHTGKRVIGYKQIIAQDWWSSPKSFERRRSLRPRFAGQTEVRVRALDQFRAFLEAYCDARKAWLKGANPCFPPGTYWLARFAPVRVAAFEN